MAPSTSPSCRPPGTWRAAASAGRVAARAGGRLAGLLGVLGGLLWGAPARAQTPLGVQVVMTSDTALTLDSNKPTQQGPHAQYVAFEITNTSGATLNNLRAGIDGFAGRITLAGGQPASLYIGSLAPGAKRTAYWFVSYPADFGAYGTANTLTVTVSDGAGNTRTGTGRVRVVSMASASAGGFTNATTIGPGAVVGQLIDVDITYQFKGWNAGETFNMQPAGNTDFAGGCFQLVRSVIVSADGNINTFMQPGTVDRQFFVATVSSNGGGSLWNVRMKYTFKYLCQGVSSTPYPYANSFSGGQLKYVWSGEGGGGGQPAIPAAPAPSASFTISKTASAAALPNGGSVTYTVAIQNTSVFNVTVDSIVDQLPAGAVYTGLAPSSGVTAARSGSMPAANATGRLAWRSNPATGTASDPSTTYYVPAKSTLSLVYTVTLPGTPGSYTNRAEPFVGQSSLGVASTPVTVGSADVSVTKTGAATVVVSDTLRYAITVSNAGPSAAAQVVVQDTLPAGVVFVSASRGGTFAAGKVTWPAVASLASGTPVTDSVVVVAPATLGATLLNVARSTSQTPDPTPANNDGTAAASRVTTTVVGPVSVTPDGVPTPLDRLRGTGYSQLFAVENRGPAAGTYNLLAMVRGAVPFLTVDSITGPGITTRVRPDSARVSLARRSSTGYTVWYTVAPGDTVTGTELLRARHATTPVYQDTGWVQIRRVSPRMTLTKSVTPNAAVFPGASLTYTIHVSNAGLVAATQVKVWDALPEQVLFRVGSLQQELPAGITAVASFSKDPREGWDPSLASWDYVPVSGGCGAPATYDACVTHVRWTLSGPLPSGSPEGTFTFGARVR